MLQALKQLVRPSPVGALKSIVGRIADRESLVSPLTDTELLEASRQLQSRAQGGEELNALLVEAFALVREAAKRTLGQRPYDVQLIGGMVLHRGAVAEMATGEGKTLAAVAPTYLNALTGKGVHVVTVNEYLARRDVAWMGQVYDALGLRVACLVPNAAFLYDPLWKVEKEEVQTLDAKRDLQGNYIVQQEFLRPISRKEAYKADITYGTNHEFGFDYLRDNLVQEKEYQVQRGHEFGIIDEVDSILIDEARTPLIIAAPDAQASDAYKAFARVVGHLTPEEDYLVDEKKRSVAITDAGIEKVEKTTNIGNLYAPENLRLVHYLEESLKAKALYRKDKEYVVKNGEIIIVDEFTGRMLHGRRYNGGLHQAIEAKEGVMVKEESRTYAKVSIQNYFRMYKKIAGMTGTAQTSAEEFHKVYKLEVVSVPTHRPLVRRDMPDAIYKTQEAKWRAVVEEVRHAHDRGQPVLLGTTSIEKNEHISGLLRRAGIPHEVLNAKNNEREGAIIAQAGKKRSVTVATNVAGRGVDIILGGNPSTSEVAEEVRHLGGLYVVGTERHEARRIDNQLRGRSGRQGDPGMSKFFLALEDDLLRIFGGDQIGRLMERFNMPEDQPIDMGVVSKAVAQAQSRVEGANFDLRKHLLEYDDVLNKQRDNVYRRRQEMLEVDPEKLELLLLDAMQAHFEQVLSGSKHRAAGAEEQFLELKKLFEEAQVLTKEHVWPPVIPERVQVSEFDAINFDPLDALLTERTKEVARNPMSRNRVLGILDLLWMNHLDDLEALSESIGLRAYGQRDPLVEYRRESHNLFKNFWSNFNAWLFANLFKLAASDGSGTAHTSAARKPAISVARTSDGEKVGRNDPCPCGAVNPATGQVYKYKKCGLVNASHHKR